MENPFHRTATDLARGASSRDGRDRAAFDDPCRRSHRSLCNPVGGAADPRTPSAVVLEAGATRRPRLGGPGGHDRIFRAVAYRGSIANRRLWRQADAEGESSAGRRQVSRRRHGFRIPLRSDLRRPAVQDKEHLGDRAHRAGSSMGPVRRPGSGQARHATAYRAGAALRPRQPWRGTRAWN
jgi:hypothetical protein